MQSLQHPIQQGSGIFLSQYLSLTINAKCISTKTALAHVNNRQVVVERINFPTFIALFNKKVWSAF
jgi:hypothetical protein